MNSETLNKKKIAILIDGDNFMHRAFHAIKPLSTKDGHPTNAITGFFKMVQNVINNHEHDYLAFCFDKGGSNFRKDIYPEYKSNRPPTHPDLKVQKPVIKDIITSWGYDLFIESEVEADDTLSSLAKKLSNEGYQVIICTSDKDMFQMINESISILDTKNTEKNKKGMLYDRDECHKKFGVYPEQIVDYLSLLGDVADNVPGVEGIGAVTASKLLQAYGTIEKIFEHKSEIKGKAGTSLLFCAYDMNITKSLIQIKSDVKVNPEFKRPEQNMEPQSLLELVDKYELLDFKKTLGLKSNTADENRFEQVENFQFGGDLLVENSDILIDVIPATKDCKETTFIVADPATNRYAHFANGSLLFSGIDIFIKECISKNIKLISNNIQHVFAQLVSRHNIDPYDLVKAELIDTKISCYGKFGSSKKYADISYLNEITSKLNLSDLRKEFALDAKNPKWNKLPSKEAVELKAEELYVIYNVYKQIHEDNALMDLDLDTMKVVCLMESNGVKINKEGLIAIEKHLTNELEKINAEIFEIAGSEFNVASPVQLKKVLFGDLGLGNGKLKSTDEKTLNSLVNDSPIISKIFSSRSLSKLISTYTQGIYNRANDNNYVHCHYDIVTTKTGRLACLDPNLHSIPVINYDEKSKIRDQFISEDGYKIYSIDYSQIEMRMLAHLSGSESLIKAFINDLDIHTETAIEIYGSYPDELSDEYRRRAKAINYGLIYGLSAKKMAEDLGISIQEAKVILDDALEKNSDGVEYLNSVLSNCEKTLKFNTILGREIDFSELKSTNVHEAAHAQRSLKSTTNQANVSELMKIVMQQFLIQGVFSQDVKLIMQVHDEFVFMIKDDEQIIAESTWKIQHIMENAIKFLVPLKTKGTLAESWGQAK